MGWRIARAALQPDPSNPGHVGASHLKHVVRNRFVGQSLEGMNKNRHHLRNI